jgi:hypothetical protein
MTSTNIETELSRYSEEELKAELKRRKTALPKKRDVSATQIVSEIDTLLTKILIEATNEDYWREEYRNSVFEVVMTSFFGEKYFDWHNKRFP